MRNLGPGGSCVEPQIRIGNVLFGGVYGEGASVEGAKDRGLGFLATDYTEEAFASLMPLSVFVIHSIINPTTKKKTNDSSACR